MIRPYYFMFEAEPTAASPSAKGIAGAIVKAFVMDDTQEQADVRIRSLLMDYAWVITKSLFVQSLPLPPDDRAVQMPKDAYELYLRALLFGYAVDFQVWAKPGCSDFVDKIRSLEPPVTFKVKC